MKHLFAILFAASLYAQVQTPLTVMPGAGSAAGEIRLRERRNQAGDDYTGWKAPEILATKVMYEMPDQDGTLGQALVTNGSKKTSWATVAGNAVPVCASTTGTDSYTCTVASFTAYSANYCIVLGVDTANTGTATLNISGVGVRSILRYGGSALVTNDILPNSPVLICYDGTAFQLPPTASPGSGAFLNGGNAFGSAAVLGTNDGHNLIFERGGVSYLELSDAGFNAAPLGVANFFTRVTKLDIGDFSGAGGQWNQIVGASFVSNSFWKLTDNGGGRALNFDRAVAGSRLSNFGVFGSVIPRRRAIAEGDDVDDVVFGDLGGPSNRWATYYGDTADFSATASASTFNAIGSPAYRVAGNTVIRADRTATFEGMTLPPGANPGYIWTSVDFSGLGEWRVAPTAVFQVSDYGAVCDGVADATAGIQATIDAAAAAGRGTVMLPHGNCKASELRIASSFIGIRGVGRSMSTLTAISAGAQLKIDTGAVPIYAFELRDVTMVGNATSGSYAIEVVGPNDFMRSVVDNVYFALHGKTLNIHNGSFLTTATSGNVTPDLADSFSQETRATGNVTLMNPVFSTGTIVDGMVFYYTFRQPLGGGITLAFDTQFTVLTSASAASSTYTRYKFTRTAGMWVETIATNSTAVTGYYDWLSFRNNLIDNTGVSGSIGLYLAGGLTSPGGVINGNQFIQGAGGRGIVFDRDFGDVVISNNHSESGDKFLHAVCGALCYYGERLVVAGNKIDNAVQPITVDNIRNSRIRGNVVLGGIPNPVEVLGFSDDLEIDSYYNTGQTMLVATENVALGAYAQGKLRIGYLDENLSNTVNGISLKDTSRDVAIGIGQELARSVGLIWHRNATPANAFAELYTFGASNPIKYTASFHSFVGPMVTETILPATVGVHDIGQIANPFGQAYFNGFTVNGTSEFESASQTTFRAGSSITIEDCSTPGFVLTAGTAGAMSCAAGGAWTEASGDVYRPTGRVGIGTAPAAPFHISDPFGAIYLDGFASFGSPNFVFRHAGGSIGAETATLGTSRIGQIGAQGWGTSYLTAASIGFYAAADFTATNSPAYIAFFTTPIGTTGRSERWRITENGDYIPFVDNQVDIGVDFSNRPKNIYLSRAAKAETIIATSLARPAVSYGSSLGNASYVWEGNYLGRTTFSGNIEFDGLVNLGTTPSPINNGYFFTLNVQANAYIRTGASMQILNGGSIIMSAGSSVVAPSGANGTSVTLSCPAGQAIKTLTISGGFTTAATCGVP